MVGSLRAFNMYKARNLKSRNLKKLGRDYGFPSMEPSLDLIIDRTSNDEVSLYLNLMKMT